MKVIKPNQEQSQRLSIILSLYNNENRSRTTLENLLNIIQKSNKDYELIVADLSGNEEVKNHLAKSKVFTELSGKGKALGFSVLHEAVASASGTYILFAHGDGMSNMSGFLNWFSQNKNQQFPDAVWTGIEKQKTANSTLSVATKLAAKCYNLLASMLTAIKTRHSFTGFNLYPADLAKELFKGKNKSGKRAQLEALYKASLSGYELKELPITLNEKNISAGEIIRLKPALFALAFSVRFFWFLKVPFTYLSGKNDSALQENVPFWNPKNPIYRLIFAILFLLGLFIMPWLSFDFGITWDEKIQNEYAHDMLKYFTSFGEDKTVLDTSKPLYNTMIYYGSFFDFLTVIVNTYLPIFDEFETRHFMNALFGFFAMVYAAMAAKETGSWRTACIAFLLIILTPTFFGHSMNNPKDIPFAAAYIFSIYQIIRLLKQMPNPKASTITYLILGIALSISIRIGGLLLLAYLGLFLGIYWLGLIRKNSFGKATSYIWPLAKLVILIGFFSFALGILFWPYGLQNPLENPLIALKSFSNFSLLTTYELFEGMKLHMAKVPWYYTLKYMWITIPLVVIAGFFISILLGWWKKLSFNRSNLMMLLFVIIFPVAYAIYKESMLYNAWRHFLFVYPAMVVLAAVGWDSIIAAIRFPAGKAIASVGLIGMLCLPLTWMIKNHPHEYIYYNEIVGGLKGAYTNYETDYYSNSVKLAAEWLIQNEPIGNKKTLIVINNEPLTASYYTRGYDSLQVAWTREYEIGKNDWDYAILTTRTMSPTQLRKGGFPPKGTIHVVEADGIPIAAVVKKQNNYSSKAYSYLLSGNSDSAAYYFKKAHEFDPLNEEFLRMLGYAYMNLGQNELALKTLDQALEIYPESYLAIDYKGLVYFNLKDMDKAVQQFVKSVSYKANFTDGYFHSAIAYMNQGNYDQAILYYNKTIEQNNGKFPDVYNQLAEAYFNIGNYHKAAESIEYSLGLNQNQPQAYVIAGNAYKKMGNESTANAYYQKAQQMGAQIN